MLFLQVLATYMLMALLATIHVNVLPLTPESIRNIFIVSLFVTSIVSLRQLLATPRIQRLFPPKLSNEERTYIKRQSRRLVTKLQGKTSYNTYNEARTVRQHLLDWLELAEAGFVTPHDTYETRRIIRYYLNRLEAFVQQPRIHLRQAPHIERQLVTELKCVNRFFRDQLKKHKLSNQIAK